MSDISEEKKLIPERRERKKIVKIILQYEDESSSIHHPSNAYLVVYPNQVSIDPKVHLHFHDFNIHWTESR